MLLNFDTWIAGKLTTALGTSIRLDYWYPNSFVKLPAVAYSTSQKNSDMDYDDDTIKASDCAVEIDVYEKNGVDDYSISHTVETCMSGLLFNLDSSIPVPDPDSKTVHRNMQFSRQGIFQTDLI